MKAVALILFCLTCLITQAQEGDIKKVDSYQDGKLRSSRYVRGKIYVDLNENKFTLAVDDSVQNFDVTAGSLLDLMHQDETKVIAMDKNGEFYEVVFLRSNRVKFKHLNKYGKGNKFKIYEYK